MQSPNTHHRRSIRLQGYDYAQCGAYFVTLCTHNHQRLFADFIGAHHHAPGSSPVLTLNAAGLAVNQCWLEIPDYFPFVELDAFIIMPNHVHGILSIGGEDGLPLRANRAHVDAPLRDGRASTVGAIVRGFKTGVTKWFRENRPEIQTVWQRNFYEHVIRNEQELNETRLYIANNPDRAQDR